MGFRAGTSRDDTLYNVWYADEASDFTYGAALNFYNQGAPFIISEAQGSRITGFDVADGDDATDYGAIVRFTHQSFKDLSVEAGNIRASDFGIVSSFFDEGIFHNDGVYTAADLTADQQSLRWINFGYLSDEPLEIKKVWGQFSLAIASDTRFIVNGDDRYIENLSIKAGHHDFDFSSSSWLAQFAVNPVLAALNAISRDELLVSGETVGIEFYGEGFDLDSRYTETEYNLQQNGLYYRPDGERVESDDEGGTNASPAISFIANSSYDTGTVLNGAQIFSVSDADGISDIDQITLWDNSQTNGAIWRYNGQEINPGGLSSGGFQFDYANRNLLTYTVGDGFNDFGFTAYDNAGAEDYQPFAVTGLGATPPVGDGNDALNTAQTLAFSDRIVTGNVGGTDPVDYFRFVTSGTGTFTIDLTGLGADIDLRLLDHQGNILSTSAASGSSNETITYSYSDYQLYYIRVDPYNSAQSNYSLGLDVTADTTPPPPPPTTEPDLQITAVSVSDTTWSDGESITVDFTVENTGGDAASSLSGIYLSTNDNFSYSDILLDFESQGTMNAGEVDPETATFTVDFAAMGIAPGTYYLGVLPDYEEAVSESSESNNDDYSDNNPIQITVTDATGSGAGKDLQITATDVSKTTWVDGESIDVNFTVVNSGDEDAARTNSGVYLSTNDNISTGDTLIYDESTGTMSAGEVNGEGGSFTVDLSAWNLDPGTYWLGTIADIDDEVDETNSSDTAEGNNDEYADANAIQITISDTTNSDNGPTLGGGRAAIELLSASLDKSVITKGEAATVSYSVRNSGASTTDSVQQGFYVSSDQIFGNTDDVYLERDGAGHLSNGEIETDTDELGDLRNLDAGDYYLFVKADYDDKFAEDNESNNVSDAIPFTVEPAAREPVVQITASDVTEAGEVIFSLTLDYSPTNKDVVVAYRIEGGSATEGVDFENRPGQQTITLTSDTTSKTIRVDTLPDGAVESDESIQLIIDSVTGGTVDQTVHTARIIDDDEAGVLPALYFLRTSAEVTEGGQAEFYLSGDHRQLNGNYTAEGYIQGLTTDDVSRVEVQFYGPNHNGDIWQLTHVFQMQNGAWTNTTTGQQYYLNNANEPYVRFNLQKDYVAARPQDTRIVVYTTDDTEHETDKEVMVRLEPYLQNTFVFEDTGFSFQRTTLLDNDEPAATPGVLSLHATTSSVTEGDPDLPDTAILFEVRRAGGSEGEVAFDWIIQSGPSDIADSNGNRGGTVTFGDGDTNPRAIVLYVPGDTIVESAEQLRVLITGVDNTQVDQERSFAIVNILDNDAANTPAQLEYPFFVLAPWLGPDGSDLGRAVVGDVIQVTDASAFSDAEGIQFGSEIYTWFRDGVAIQGADSASYTLTDEDVGAAITVQLTFTDGAGNEEVHTSSTAISVSDIPDDNVAPVYELNSHTLRTDLFHNLSVQGQVNLNVVEQGSGDQNNQFELFISKDDKLDASDTRLISTQLSNGIGSGVTLGVGFNYTVPNSIALGSHFLLSTVNFGDRIELLGASNVEVNDELLPDLRISGGAWSTKITAGEIASYTSSVHNYGDRNDVYGEPLEQAARSEEADLHLYLSRDGILDSSDLLLGTSSVGALDWNEKSQGHGGVFHVPSFVEAGTYSAIWVVDQDDKVRETDETNNQYVFSGIEVTADQTQLSFTGSAFDDDIARGSENDTVLGGDGHDTIDGGAGFDALHGGSGNDEITDAHGANIDGGDGRDKATTLAGNNTLRDSGTVSNKTSLEIDDVFFGGLGDDSLSGGEGNDILIADAASTRFAGADTIDGSIGVDLLSGGYDTDVFYFETYDSTGTGVVSDAILGADVIGHFDRALINSELNAANPLISNLNPTGADFQIGIDVIQLAGFGAATQTAMQTDLDPFLTQTSMGAQFEAEGVRILFAGVDEADLMTAGVSDVFDFV